MRGLKFGIVATATLWGCVALAQLSVPVSYLSAASTNSTLVKTGPGQIAAMVLVNTTASAYTLKLYDKATAPTCGTDTPVQRIPIPSLTTGAGFATSFPVALNFINGIGFCLTGAMNDADTTNAAVGIAINLGIK